MHILTRNLVVRKIEECRMRAFPGIKYVLDRHKILLGPVWLCAIPTLLGVPFFM